MKASEWAYCFLTVYSFVWDLDAASTRVKDLHCEEEYSSSFSYNRFHPVSNIANLTDDGLHLDFKVRTASNAHILFSETAFPGPKSMTYEVVIGANRNTNSDIRRGKGVTKQRISTPNIVSSREIRGFWIYIHRDGRILVGKENDTMPILMWKDSSPIKVRFISFSTWREVIGNWYFNCKHYKGEEEATDEVITTSKPLTWTEKLHSDLRSHYDPNIAPRPSNSAESERTVVFVHLACRHVELNEKRSTIDVHGTLSMSWKDEKLQWSPSEYGNVTTIVVQAWEAWIPDIMLYNSAAPVSMDILYGLKDVGMIVSHDGTVFWAPHAHFSAFCENIDMTKWPKDTQTCELKLGFWSQQHLLQLSLWENTSYLEENRVETEWKVADMTAETVWIRTPWANTAVELGMDIPLLEDGTDLVDPVATDDSGELEIVVHSSMAIRLTLVRRNSAYNIVFLIPLAIILIITLLSFWAFPLGPVKLALQCLSLLTVTLFLLATWRSLPAHADHIPSIVSAYQTAMIMTCISIVETVIIIYCTRYPPVRKLPSLITLVLTSELTTTLFFLPTNGEQVNIKYSSLEETPQPNEGLEKSDDPDLQWNWILLSTLIDRTLFFIYSILFFYIFSAF